MTRNWTMSANTWMEEQGPGCIAGPERNDAEK